MVSLAKVCAVIDAADVSFQKCWSTLEAIKENELADPWRQHFADFQEDLGQALVRLDDLYRSITQEKRALVARKRTADPARFRRRMKQLELYREALRRAIRIGKSLGDAFAWLFYQGEQHLIEKHLQNPGDLHTPPGIGGLGEIGFTQRFKIFDNHVAIYHATTNFLRIGDVSFVHLPTMTVSAIGELKTKKIDAETLSTTMVMMGDADLPNRMPSLSHGRPSKKKREPLLAVYKDRLLRQIKKMSETLDAKQPDRTMETRYRLNIGPLVDLLAHLKTTRLIHKKIDDGLLIVGVRVSRRGTRLSSRLLPRRPGNVAKITEPTTRIAMELLDKSTNKNCLLIDHIKMHYVPGTTPLLWAPLPASVLKPLFFKEAIVWSWFNPLHLVRKLCVRGFEVQTNADGIPAILRKRVGGRTGVAQGIDQYIVLLLQCLVTEDGFVALMEQLFEGIQSANISSNVGISIPLTQFFGDAPPDRETRVRRAAERHR